MQVLFVDIAWIWLGYCLDMQSLFIMFKGTSQTHQDSIDNCYTSFIIHDSHSRFIFYNSYSTFLQRISNFYGYHLDMARI